MTTTTTTDPQKAVLDLAKAKSDGFVFAYAFGFTWGILTDEQRATLERHALEVLAEIEE
jgi:hypothetical protein